MTDPEIERQEQLATRELASRLTGWAVGMKQPTEFAQRFIADLRAHGWKPPLDAPPDWRTRNADPAAAHRGAQLARRALAGEDIE
jgi:hypothetical protein